MAIEVGTAYLSILPSTDKIAPGIKSALGESQKAANTAGKAMGADLANSIKKGLQDAENYANNAGKATGKQYSKGVKASTDAIGHDIKAVFGGTQAIAKREGIQAGTSYSKSFASGIGSISTKVKETFGSLEKSAKSSGARIKAALTPKSSDKPEKPSKEGKGVGIGAVTGLVAGASIGAFFKDTVSGASDAQQSIGATETVFGKFSDTVVKKSKLAAKAQGISANTYRENANLIGSLLKNQGVSADKLAGQTDAIIAKGADLSATFGGTTTEAVEAQTAAYKGEFDQLEKYGISIKQDTVNQEAMRVAHVKSTAEFNKLSTAQQTAAKRQATTNLINKQSASSTGAFAKESDTLAHQQQVLGAKFDDIKTKVGSALLPVLTKFFAYISEKLLPKIKEWWTGFKENLLPAIQNVASWLKDHLQPPLTAIGDWMRNNGPTVKAFAITVGILALAIGIWAAVQWLLNSALLASPITWIVLGIAALVAAIVYAWTHFETFRKVVLAVWSGIQTAISFAWNNVILPVFNAIKWFITNVLVPVFTWLWKNIIVPVFTGIASFIGGVWTRLIRPLFQAIGWYVSNVLAPFFTWFWHKIIEPVFSGIATVVGKIWRTGIRPIFSAIGDFIGKTVAPAFQRGVDSIGTIWDTLKGLALTPVNFVIDTVYNNGIRKLINSLPGVDDVPAMALLGQPAARSAGGVKNQSNRGRNLGVGRAHGGPIYGPGTATSDSIPARLSNGEHVWTAAEVKAAGGQKAVYALRKAVLSGGLGKTFDPPAAFASGGALTPEQIKRGQEFAKSQVGDPYVWGGVGPNGFDCSGFMSAITNEILGRNPYSRVGATASFPWSGFQPGPGQFTIGSTNNYGGSGIGHMAGTLGGMNVESRGGRGVVIGNAARGYNDKGFNTVAHLGSTDTSASGGILSAIKDVLNGLKGWVTELSNMGGFGGLISQVATKVVHDVGEFAKSKASFGIFDDGGILQPGGVAFNASNKPEAVFNHKQFAQYANDAKSEGSGLPQRVTLNIDGKEFDGFFSTKFDDKYDDAVNYRR